MAYLNSVPFPGVLLVIYNIMAFTGDIHARLNGQVFSLGLVSGASWTMTTAELLLAVGVIALYFELVKSTRATTQSIVDHVLSLAVFVIYLLEFVTVAACGTSTFLILGLMAALDTVAGFTISIVSARRDLAVNPNIQPQ